MSFATLTQGQERPLAGISKQKAQQTWVKEISQLNTKYLGDRINEIFNEVNKEHLIDTDENNIVSEPVILGVLEETESVHWGLLMDVEGQTVAGIIGMALINEVAVSQGFYSHLVSTNTLRDLLAKSKKYSTKLHQLNAEE